MMHPKPQFKAGEEVSITATVEAIDYQSRVVTLKVPNGNLVDILVREEAYNFDNIQKGDDVVVRYIEAVAISVRAASSDETN